MESKNKTVRSWLGTLNNPTVDTKDFLENFYKSSGARYVTGQLEKGAEGTIHIQYFINFKQSVRLAALKKICKQSHFEAVRVDNGAGAYC